MPLRPLAEADLDMILEWRNQQAVRLSMYSQHHISPEEHRAWHERMSRDPACHWLVFARGDVPVGVAYFTNISPNERTAEWGFYTAPHAIAGTGTLLGIEVLTFGFRMLAIDTIDAEVLASNSASLRLHSKLGFTEQRRFIQPLSDGTRFVQVVRHRLNADQWAITRQSLLAPLERFNAEQRHESTSPD